MLYAYYHGFESLDESLDVNHIDGNKENNTKENLELITVQENLKHKFKIGLQSNLGVKNARAILSEEQVLEIKTLINDGCRNVDIAKMFNIHHKHVSLIRRGKRWSHI